MKNMQSIRIQSISYFEFKLLDFDCEMKSMGSNWEEAAVAAIRTDTATKRRTSLEDNIFILTTTTIN